MRAEKDASCFFNNFMFIANDVLFQDARSRKMGQGAVVPKEITR